MDIVELKPNFICLSPGPGRPREAGGCLDLVRDLTGIFPMLGICLGHQAIGEGFGGRITHSREIMHGKTTSIFHNEVGLFKDIPNPFKAVRYNSLTLDEALIPSCLEVTAWSPEGEIMGVRHKYHSVEGVQFHPESALSEYGHTLLRNFLNYGPPILGER